MYTNSNNEKKITIGMLNTISLALMIFLLNFNGGSAGEALIAELRSQGWIEIDRHEEIKNFPGDIPYEKLTRVIQLIHYVFEKDGMKKICWISYDSQRDQMREGCELQ